MGSLRYSRFESTEPLFEILEVRHPIFSHGVLFRQEIDDCIVLPECKCWNISRRVKCQDHCEFQLSEILKKHYEETCRCRSESDYLNESKYEYKCSFCWHNCCELLRMICITCEKMNQTVQEIENFKLCNECHSYKLNLYRAITTWVFQYESSCKVCSKHQHCRSCLSMEYSEMLDYVKYNMDPSFYPCLYADCEQCVIKTGVIIHM